jgi:preprotein translocase subunit SecY
VHIHTYRQKVLLWIKQLNVFKSAEYRSADNIKQQHVMTWVYLILFSGMIIFFANVFVAINPENKYAS